MSRTPALIAITRRGAARAMALAARWPGAVPMVLEGLAPAGVAVLKKPLSERLPGLFQDHDPLVFFAALGAVVRLIAPLLRSKREDPAVLAVDEAARFVIPVVSGHLGGANDQARRLATLLGAQAVITTASDVAGLPAVDLLGRDLGWQLDASPRALTWAAGRVVNGDPVALVQDCGNRSWRQAWDPWPDHVILLDQVEQADPAVHSALLWITRRETPPALAARWADRLVRYRPPPGQGEALAIGLGCDRGTPLATLTTLLDRTLAERGLDRDGIRAIATIDLKGDEPALRQLAAALNLPLRLYGAQRLATVTVPHPSEVVRRHVGTPSVSEAAALLAAGATLDHLLVDKARLRGPDGRNATLAVAVMQLEL
ncbi:MAG: cobalamin biosynthesis protein [Magnetococcales bacterium]|nr:cobalamin biosynthesis protein [Magnetococcales bacterium]